MNQELIVLFEQIQSPFMIIFLGTVAIEWIVLLISKKLESSKEGWVNLLSYVVESIPYILLGKIVILGFMLWIYNYRIFTLGTAWYVWIACYILYDFLFYVIHYLGHRVRLFWCIHGVHHTAEEIKLSVAVRGSFLGFLLTPHNVIWLPLLGFDPFMVLIVDAVGKLYGLYEHANENIIGKQPVLEKVLITPSAHRVHHSSNHIYLDRNYGETFSIWDRIFGTFQTELHDEKPVYGMMDEKVDGKNFIQIQTILWKELWIDVKNAPTFSDKLKYIFMPPGWNHIDGGRLAESFREEAWEIKKSSL